MFGRFKDILKKASTAVFGGAEEQVQQEQKLGDSSQSQEIIASETLTVPVSELQQLFQARQEQLRQYAETFKENNAIEPHSSNSIAINRFLEKVSSYSDADLLLAVEEGLERSKAAVKASRQTWALLNDQRFVAMEMRHAVSVAYLSLCLKLVTSNSNAKLKSNAAVDKVMEQKSLLGMMKQVFWLSFSYFEKVDAMISATIAQRVNEALEDERQTAVQEYNKYRKLVYDLLGDKIDVEELLEEITFEKTGYEVKGINLDSAYVGVFSVLGTIISVLWKVLLVLLFILGMPLTTMMTVVAHPTWVSYITKNPNPYVLAFCSFLTLFVVGLFIVMAVRLFVWNPAVVNSFQQKYRIIGSSLNVYVDGYWQPKLDALERQYEVLKQKMEHYFQEERANISGLNELQLSRQINDARLMVQFYKGVKVE